MERGKETKVREDELSEYQEERKVRRGREEKEGKAMEREKM